MLQRQDADSSFSFGYNSQGEIDQVYAQDVLKVLRLSNKTAILRGKNHIPFPKSYSPAQNALYEDAVLLAGDASVSDYNAPSSLWRLDASFSSFDEIARAIRSLAAPDIIINLTQHAGTPEQGVTDPENKSAVQAALTFDTIPSKEEMAERAIFLANIAKESCAKKAMIGGAPFFMSALERALLDVGITPLYAFSVRESVEKAAEDGTVTKTNVFKHIGFVEL